jgi:hypothetical protein
MMAGAAEPGVPGGALSIKPMIIDVFGKTSRVDGQCKLATAVGMKIQGRQAIDLKYLCACLFTQYAESHGQLLVWRLEAWSSTLRYYWMVEYRPTAPGELRTRPPLGSSAGAGAYQTGHYSLLQISGSRSVTHSWITPLKDLN